jgi:pyrroline-5-carboxylate reductase
MTVVSVLPPSDQEEIDRAVILKIFSSIGRCRFLEEKHFDACTALSGSGPAFACIFMEAMADGGVMMGLPRAEALELAAQSKYTLLLTLWFCLNITLSITRCRSYGPARRNSPCANQRFGDKYVCYAYFTKPITHISLLKAPGGCTIAGLLALEDGRVRSTIARGIQIATERASELGQPGKK